MKEYYQINSQDIIKDLNSSFSGLDKKEALIRLNKDGLNELDKIKKRNIFLKFLDQFNDFMIIILLFAAATAIIFSIINRSNDELIEAFIILAIVLINAFLGLFQELKSEKALDEIKSLSSPHILVLRDNVESIVEAKELVKGDIILLKAGDIIPADIRIIKSYNLSIDESILTGESLPVNKIDDILEGTKSLGDQINLGFMSTVVTRGTGIGIVIKTGMETEIGKISSLLNDAKPKETPLQKNISDLGQKLVYIILSIVILIFLVQFIRDLVNNDLELIKSLMISITLAVAAIPEGLPAIVTIILSLGMQRLVKKGAILKSLPAVETLGSTSIICSDKTGTLTQNKMTIENVYFYQNELKVKDQIKNEAFDKFLILTILGNNATLIRDENNNLTPTGDPTAKAFLSLALNQNVDLVNILNSSPKLYELPFDSTRKLNTSIHKIDDKLISITIGAPDVLFEKIKLYQQENQNLPFNLKIKKDLNDKNDEYAKKGLRVVGVCYKELPLNFNLKTINPLELENDLTFLALSSMSDPIKEEVIETINQTKRAGIKTIMITGDHKSTAISIAKQLNILNDNELAITGLELDNLSDDDYLKEINKITVYARVSPENKVRIVKAWQSLGHIVAMTGDGVNDAPSLKIADIGISMGESGTEVAKDASDLILTDDNFTTIVDTVFEGRTIYKNLKNVIRFLLSSNIGELLTIIFGITIGLFIFPSNIHLQILSASQILWVNLVTDAFVAIGIGLEPKNSSIMNEKPRDNTRSIFDKKVWLNIFMHGLMIGLISFIAFMIGYQKGGIENAQTLTFMTLALSQIVHSFNFRDDSISIFKLKVNKTLIYMAILSFILQLMTVIIPVLSNNVFNTIPIYNWDSIDFITVLSLSLVPLLIIELSKLIIRIKKES